MKRACRIVLLALLFAALPLRGYAGVLTALCESHMGALPLLKSMRTSTATATIMARTMALAERRTPHRCAASARRAARARASRRMRRV